jgi:hypothetical protein
MCRLFYFANRDCLSGRALGKRAHGEKDDVKVRRFVIVLQNLSLYRSCEKTNSIGLDSSDFYPKNGRFRPIQ